MGLPLTEAADLGVAARIANQLANGTTIQERMELAGLGETVLLRKLKEKLNAKETKFFADKGIVTDSRNVVAHDIQLRAIITALKMRGILSDRALNVNVGEGNVGILVSDGTPHAQWTPQLSTPNSNTSASINDSNPATTTITSTLVGTGKRRGGLGHDHRNVRNQAKRSPNGKLAKRLRASNGRHGAGANIPNGNNGKGAKLRPPKSKRSSKPPVKSR